MNEERKTLKEIQKIEYYDNEIELIDILRVLWKWKYLIISGSIVCGLIAAIISITMIKVYSIDMTLKSSILDIREEGNTVYIDSPQNIKALIESGVFNNDISDYLDNTKMGKVPQKLYFKVTIPKKSDIIKVRYKTANIKQGMVITDRLGHLLIKEYDKLIQHFKSEYDIKQNSIEHKIDYLEAMIQSHNRNVKNIKKRNNELITEIGLIKNSTADLVMEKNKFLSKNPQTNKGFQDLFYIYLIQQNLEISNNYQNIINENNLKKENQLQQIQKYASKIKENMDEIKKIQAQKEEIQNIQILEPPAANPYPVRPKMKLNVILAVVAGLFLMILLSFLLEYLKKYNKSNRQ